MKVETPCFLNLFFKYRWVFVVSNRYSNKLSGEVEIKGMSWDLTGQRRTYRTLLQNPDDANEVAEKKRILLEKAADDIRTQVRDLQDQQVALTLTVLYPDGKSFLYENEI